MDQQRDFATFRSLMARLCETMSKPVTDELIEAWWKSLRTVNFDEVERRMEVFIARATDTTRFPRPGQFRPDDVPQAADPRDESRDRRILDDNRRNWSAHIAADPVRGHTRMQLAQCSRIMAITHESLPAYEEAFHEYLRLEKQMGENGRFS